MPVKYWSFAGLIVTYWCNARCASCYLCCGPGADQADGGQHGKLEHWLGVWRGLAEASPIGCRIHISGGEPFGDWPRLIELCRRAKRDGLLERGPLEKVETNAFWATDEETVRQRLRALDEAGMGKLTISTDPYHQQFVPIQRCRLAAKVAEEVLGARRLQVRWRDWLSEGFDTDQFSADERAKLFLRYASWGRDRPSGRAAQSLAPFLSCKPWSDFADKPCNDRLLRSRHVHVDGQGLVMPGTCAGIVLGRIGPPSVAEIWHCLDLDHATRPIVGTLARAGPVGLLDAARAAGYAPRSGYAGKCHLCWDVRQWFVLKGMHKAELGPAAVYQAAGDGLGDEASGPSET